MPSTFNFFYFIPSIILSSINEYTMSQSITVMYIYRYNKSMICVKNMTGLNASYSISHYLDTNFNLFFLVLPKFMG